MTDKSIGLYIHYPFCVRKCLYCDFYSQSDISLTAEYCNALVDELAYFGGERVDSIYFGGGTPCLMPRAELCKILEVIAQNYSLAEDCEITLEANPGAMTYNKLSPLGINRLSIGAQSFVDRELLALGRIHRADDIERTLCAADIDDVNLDIMFGIPYQTDESFAFSLEKAKKLVGHISVYGLIIEKNTPFYQKRETLALPDEDSEADMYFDACRILCDYEHYEISNFAKTKRCRHNMKYWQCEEYIGFGPSAHSYYKGRRFGNSRDILGYIERIKNKKAPEKTEDIFVNQAQRREEYIMLSCRLSDGVDLSRLPEEGEIILKKLEKYIKGGYAVLTDKGFRLTEKGFYISNTIISDIL